jgi:uncharacterized phage protein gp47/JayE
MADNRTQQQIQADDFKRTLQSYSYLVDINSTGTQIDVDANVVGAQIAAVVDYVNQVQAGNLPQNAPDFMLEQWALDLGLGARKVGYFATGQVFVTNPDATKYPITINRGMQFNIGSLIYTVVNGLSVATPTTAVTVRAVKVGAEYNIKSGVVLASTLTDGWIVTSQGIGGGSGRETNAQLLNRILLNIQFRRTDCTLADYNQKASNFYNYVSSVELFVPSIPAIKYGVKITAINTIDNYEDASKNSELNDISLSPQQISELTEYFYNERSAKDIVVVDTMQTQEIPAGILVVDITSRIVLTTDNINVARANIRQALLEWQGEQLYPTALIPNFSDNLQITSYVFHTFPAIPRTSVVMDSINIQVNQINPPI